MGVTEEEKQQLFFFFLNTAGLVAFTTGVSLKKLASPFQLYNLVSLLQLQKKAQIKKVTYTIVLLRGSNRTRVIQLTRVKLH